MLYAVLSSPTQSRPDPYLVEAKGKDNYRGILHLLSLKNGLGQPLALVLLPPDILLSERLAEYLGAFHSHSKLASDLLLVSLTGGVGIALPCALPIKRSWTVSNSIPALPLSTESRLISTG